VQSSDAATANRNLLAVAHLLPLPHLLLVVYPISIPDRPELFRFYDLALALHNLDEVADDVIELLCFAQKFLALLLHRNRPLQHFGRHDVQPIAIGIDALLRQRLERAHPLRQPALSHAPLEQQRPRDRESEPLPVVSFQQHTKQTPPRPHHRMTKPKAQILVWKISQSHKHLGPAGRREGRESSQHEERRPG
jgi:hypothetical protein